MDTSPTGYGPRRGVSCRHEWKGTASSRCPTCGDVAAETAPRITTVQEANEYLDRLRRESWASYDALLDARLHEALSLLGRPDDWAGMGARREIYWCSPFGQPGHRQLVHFGPKGDTTLVLATNEPAPSADCNVVRWFVSAPWPNGHPPHLRNHAR